MNAIAPLIRRAAVALAAVAVLGPQSAHAQTINALDTTLRDIARRTAPVAFAVVVVRNDSVIHLGTYGLRDGHQPTTPRTAFYIGSSTKSFTALTAALLAQRGKVDLDQPITRYAPEFALPPPLDGKRVTLRVMLSHRGGFDSDPLTFRTAFSGTLGEDSLLAVLARTATPVDTSFEYTNTQYIVAARVLERVTGTPWQDLLARDVFEPLGLREATARASHAARNETAVGWAYGPAGWRRLPPKVDATMHAAGGMFMSAADVARWLRAQMADGRVGGVQVFPPGVVASTHVLTAAQRDTFDGIPRFGYGLGWQLGILGADTLVHHFGNYPGAFAHISFMPARHVGVAVFINSELRPFGQAADRIAELAYDVALGRDAPTAATLPASITASIDRMVATYREDAVRRAARPRVPPRGWRAYAGRYGAPDWGTLEVVAQGDSAEVRFGTLRSRLEVMAGDTLRVEWPPGRSGRRVPAEFGPDGRATAITIDDVTYRRVK